MLNQLIDRISVKFLGILFVIGLLMAALGQLIG